MINCFHDGWHSHTSSKRSKVILEEKETVSSFHTSQNSQLKCEEKHTVFYSRTQLSEVPTSHTVDPTTTDYKLHFQKTSSCSECLNSLNGPPGDILLCSFDSAYFAEEPKKSHR